MEFLFPCVIDPTGNLQDLIILMSRKQKKEVVVLDYSWEAED